MDFPLPEIITVWNKIANDGFGGFTWSSPQPYDARIAYTQEKFTDSNGDSKMSTAVAYSKGLELRVDSRVFFGESEAIEPPQEADDVRAISQIPSGAGDLKKVWFG